MTIADSKLPSYIRFHVPADDTSTMTNDDWMTHVLVQSFVGMDELRNDIFKEKNLTFARVLELANEFTARRRSMKEPTSTNSVNSIAKTPYRQKKQQGLAATPAGGSTASTTKSCGMCGLRPHRPGFSCPAKRPGISCDNCRKPGHFRKVCRSPAAKVVRTVVDGEPLPEYHEDSEYETGRTRTRRTSRGKQTATPVRSTPSAWLTEPT